MADSKESFEILENGSGDGVSASSSQQGDASSSKIGMTVFPFKDSGGNLRIAKVNASDILQTDGSSVTQPVSATSLPLPTGAATESTLSTISTEVGGLTETVPATDTASSGLNGRLQRIAQRLTSLIALLPTSLGQKTMANSLAVTVASDQSAISFIRSTPPLVSYSVSASAFICAAAATDVYVIKGSSTKTIKITSIEISGTTTAGSGAAVTQNLIKRSTANTGGTFVSGTIVNHDSNDAAATATAGHYTANPTLGTQVGIIRSRRQTVGSVGSASDDTIWDFGTSLAKPIYLRGVAETLAINFNGATITNPVISIRIEFTEE